MPFRNTFQVLATHAFCILPNISQAGATPKNLDEAIRIARLAFDELDAGQKAPLGIGRPAHKAQACRYLADLTALYPVTGKKTVQVTVIEKVNGVSTSVTKPYEVNLYDDANIDSIELCFPGSIWERKDAMSSLHYLLMSLFEAKISSLTSEPALTTDSDVLLKLK